MKNCTSLRLLSILVNFLRLSSMGLAGVLPPAGQIFGKLHFLEILPILAIFVVTFKQGSSRGAASLPAGLSGRSLCRSVCQLALNSLTNHVFSQLACPGLQAHLVFLNPCFVACQMPCPRKQCTNHVFKKPNLKKLDFFNFPVAPAEVEPGTPSLHSYR